MKRKNIVFGLMIACTVTLHMTMWGMNAQGGVEKYKEILVQYNDKLEPLYASLTPQERVFTYFLHRASLPGNLIATDQIHRDGRKILELFEQIVQKSDTLGRAEFDFDINAFIDQAKTYGVYLFLNHGQYFQREKSNEKRTPAKLGLGLLTENNLTAVIKALGEDPLIIKAMAPSLFDATYEPTSTVPGSIEQGCVNFYSRDFTGADFERLSPQERSQLNSYCYVEHKDGKRIPRIERYCMQGKYAKELDVAVYWLRKSHACAAQHPSTFDPHFVKSLEYLIAFLEVGDEELFKKHSAEWLKTKSRIDYNYGFVETLRDPMSARGSFQSDVTVKVFNPKLGDLIPHIEAALPFPDEFKRDENTVPNASVNESFFNAGDLGPQYVVSAYCLPNYEDIREELGSKQIMYSTIPDIGALLNPRLHRELFFTKAQREWMEQNDPDNKLSEDIWNLQCLLHETIGHASGKLAMHRNKDGTVTAVTNSNLRDFLVGYGQTIEELRAEIISLYVSANHLDELLEHGFLTEWAHKLSKKELQERVILRMANVGLRLQRQSDDASSISGDHARANQTIMNFLLEGRGITLVEEGPVLACAVDNLDKALAGITELARLTQTIKSTGDGDAAKKLIETYGVKINPHHFKTAKNNFKAVAGDVKVVARLFPHYEPVVNGAAVIDVKTSRPADIVEQWLKYRKLALSKEL